MGKYFGAGIIILCFGIVLLGLAFLGYNTGFSLSKEKIEVTTHNSNFQQNSTNKDE